MYATTSRASGRRVSRMGSGTERAQRPGMAVKAMTPEPRREEMARVIVKDCVWKAYVGLWARGRGGEHVEATRCASTVACATCV
jgi:hypothetical protein